LKTGYPVQYLATNYSTISIIFIQAIKWVARLL
jgi:hypothetical protein